MTTFLVLTAILVVVAVVAALRELRHDHPSAPPASHPDWTLGRLPSAPYSPALTQPRS
ncbi:MAG: hypothetical protein ACRDWY_05540 [Actinomycetes bacterium]